MVFVIYIAAGVEGAAFGESCTTDVDCPEANNVCTSMACACNADSFRKNGMECATKIALAGACTATPPDQCAATNAVCQITDLICVCMANFFADKNAGCSSQVTALDGVCDAADSAPDQCVVPDSECRSDKCLCKATHYTAGGACVIRKSPDATCGGAECVTHASCVSTKCVCDAGYTPSPTVSPTMCNGVVKITTLTHMYVIPILASVMFFLR
ncbi:uncharacterized protein LOC143046938 [Mytilus galloprovincialis]|uniref:uncharacterized protein LOC143046938 n=1 Tax=Mytilus galloprovincialis TaxID=29158 RepID=UPI003F7B6578